MTTKEKKIDQKKMKKEKKKKCKKKKICMSQGGWYRRKIIHEFDNVYICYA